MVILVCSLVCTAVRIPYG